ncbi:MAG: thiamine pyrophosphate-binding protein [Spirochaetes bacterium]|nr:thiamine pyrophosphate-binding protein [Spirochaetota bacterium]
MNRPVRTIKKARASKVMSGAGLLVRTLADCGVEFIFMEEHPDTEPVRDAALRQRGLKVIHPVSETSCVPMADVCSRYTGRPVVALTAGGGHCLNQVMGMTTAWGDKSPVISIGIARSRGAGASPVFDRERTDPCEVFSSISVYHETVRAWSDMREIICRGVRESLSAKGGTVHIEIPIDIIESTGSLSSDASPGDTECFAQVQAPVRAEEKKIDQAVDLLLRAKRPMIFAGGGAVRAGAAQLVNDLARKAGIPILSSMGAMDVVDPANPMYVGPSSYLAGEAFHYAIEKADVVLAIGACFGGLDGFGLPPLWSGKIKFIQVNIDPTYIAFNPGAEIAIVADARETVNQLMERIEAVSSRLPDWTSWVSSIKRRYHGHVERVACEAKNHKSKNGRLHPAAAVLAVLDRIVASDALVCVDGGNTPLWAGMFASVKGPRRVFFPTGMATLGVGIPMALGLKTAAGNRRVILFTGDGSLLYNIQELELIKRYNLPIIIAVNNDSAWNMIRAGEIMLHRCVGTALPEQDYAAVAESYGIPARRISSLDEIPAALDKAFSSNGPMLFDIATDNNVYPDSLASFIRVEFMGSLMPQPLKKMLNFYQNEIKIGRNVINIMKYLMKTM